MNLEFGGLEAKQNERRWEEIKEQGTLATWQQAGSQEGRHLPRESLQQECVRKFTVLNIPFEPVFLSVSSCDPAQPSPK